MTETLGPTDLNRTLLARQLLLERETRDPVELVGHLVGLQAQATLPPYLSLAARLEGFDPRVVSEALAANRLVRLQTMRGTVHLLTPADALSLREFTEPVQLRERKASQNLTSARALDRDEFRAAVRTALAGGALPVKDLGLALAKRWPDVPPTELGGLARVDCPLAQVPPRGGWKQSGGVVYQHVDDLLGEPLTPPDVPDLVRRYLRAFGPATAADVTAWSGVTGMVAVLKGMDDLLVRRDADGKALYDVADAPLVSGDTPAPVRLLGLYDNVWLSHAGRDRVTPGETRKRWMGPNGGMANTLFVDGRLAGLWRIEDDRPLVVETFRDLTRSEQADLDDELERVRALLAVPPAQ